MVPTYTGVVVMGTHLRCTSEALSVQLPFYDLIAFSLANKALGLNGIL